MLAWHSNALDKRMPFELLRRTSAKLDATLTIPNVMTSMRLLMAVAAAVLFTTSHFETLAASLCLAGVILDATDGWYARRFAQCSQLGEFLDPLADKLLMGIVYGVIAANMGSPLIWTFFALVVGRDLVVTVSRSLSFRKRGSTFPADKLGKVKMLLQSTAGMGLLGYAYILGGGFTFSHYPVVMILVVVTVLSYVSAGRYLLSRASTAAPGSRRVR